MSCDVGRRRVSDPELLWLWCRPEATAPIRPLAWEAPYAAGAALGKAKRQKKKKSTESYSPSCGPNTSLSTDQWRSIHTGMRRSLEVGECCLGKHSPQPSCRLPAKGQEQISAAGRAVRIYFYSLASDQSILHFPFPLKQVWLYMCLLTLSLLTLY